MVYITSYFSASSSNKLSAASQLLIVATMVRTKTRARTLKERFPNGPPQIRLPPGGTFTPNNRIFTEHNGKEALMSWESTSRNPVLLPLPCWVFYITHPYEPSEFDGCAFFNRL